MKPRLSATTALAFCLLLIPFASRAQGLRFVGHNNRIEERTSLEIQNLKRVSVTDSLVLEFDLWFDGQTSEGYIFRLRTGREENSPTILLHYTSDPQKYSFRLIWQGRRFLMDTSIPTSAAQMSWLKFRIRLMPQEGTLSLGISDRLYLGADMPLPVEIVPDLCFGMTSKLLEVPSMEMRNLAVGIDGRRIVFPLDEDSGNTARSNSPTIRGKVTNPVWLVEQNQHWRFEGRHNSPSFIAAGYDSLRHQTYLVSRDSIFTFDITRQSSSSRRLPDSCPVRIVAGNSFVNPNDGRICVYETGPVDYVREESTVAALNPETLDWESLSSERIGNQLHHHSQWFDAGRDIFWIFGGYGNKSYSNVFHGFDPAEGRWSAAEAIGGEGIWPRFLQSMGFSHERGTLMVFGGRGNESGEQVIGYDYFYDLHEIDTSTWQSRKLWEIDWQGRNMVASRNMLVKGDNFYTLMYDESKTHSQVQLYRFSIRDGSHESLGDSFPIFSDRIGCNVNLYYDSRTERLMAVVEETDDDICSTVSVYSMAYPPMKSGMKTVVRQRIRRSFCGVALALALLCVPFIARRRKKPLRHQTMAETFPKEPERDAICLFGTFKAFDSDGEDVSKRFTGKLRILLYLLISAGEKGLSATDISLMLWPEKEESESNNIRSVTIHKLRKALSGLRGTSVEFAEGRYRLIGGEGFYCDLLSFLSDISDGDISGAVGRISKGKFLSSDSDPALDRLKEETETKVLLTLEKGMAECLRTKDYRGAVRCAEMVFWSDPLNGDAISCIVKALNRTGQKLEAHRRYLEFAGRYSSCYSEPYQVKFKDL